MASLRITPIAVDFGAKTFVIPALPAAAWLEPLLSPQVDMEGIFPGLCSSQDRLDVYQMLIDGEASDDELLEAIEQVIEAASGRRWWITIRLCASLRATWDWLGGDLARNGITASDVPLGWWLDGAYMTLVAGMLKGSDESEMRRVSDWNMALTMPPAGLLKAEFDEEENSRAFLAAMRASR